MKDRHSVTESLDTCTIAIVYVTVCIRMHTTSNYHELENENVYM
jgi:hypothetical protein